MKIKILKLLIKAKNALHYYHFCTVHSIKTGFTDKPTKNGTGLLNDSALSFLLQLNPLKKKDLSQYQKVYLKKLQMPICKIHFVS